ncbi:restriction endonuclease subunit S, partial [Treponema pedis]|uniref:restriction endonuclease subunit S n=1 Tax=Treponema pedis TaxID=409322 RepID=UPI001267AD09
MSVVRLSEIDNNLLRIEAEYFQKKYINMESIVNSYNTLSCYTSKIDCGPFGSNLLDTKYESTGILVVRPFNLKNYTIEKENLVYISKETVIQNKLKIYNKGTLLFSRVGDIKVGISNQNNITISPNVIAVKLKNADFAKYLAVFFHTKYGFLQIERNLKVSAQPTISTEIISKLKVLYNIDTIQKVAKIFDKALELIDVSQQKYSEAENLLLETLQLKDFHIANEPVNIKSIKESFLKTGRLDAEFYQHKYEAIEQKIKMYQEGFARLCDVCIIKDESFIPEENTVYSYIELSDIGTSGEVTGCTLDQGKNLPSRAKRKVNKNDVIISSIEGSLSSCAIISKCYHNALCSTGFYVLASKTINAETLLVLFKSELMQQILKRNCSGTILTAINKEEFLNLPIPVIAKEYQTKIAEYIQKAQALREEAKSLLENAKLQVEKEISANSSILP